MGRGGWVESRIKLISAEAEALLGLAELGKIDTENPCKTGKTLLACLTFEPWVYHMLFF